MVRMGITKEELEKYMDEVVKINILVTSQKISLEEGESKIENIHKKIRNYKNYFEFDNWESYFEKVKKTSTKLAKKAKNQSFLQETLSWIEHEREHAAIDEGYNLPTTYCFLRFKHRERGIGIFPFVYVKKILSLQEDWSEFDILKYEARKLSAPKKLSEGDVGGLEYLKNKIKISDLIKNQKIELLEIIDRRLERDLAE